MEDQNSNFDGARARSPTLRDLLAIVFRHRGLARLLLPRNPPGDRPFPVDGLPKQYEAEMKILVKRERTDPVITSDPNASMQFSTNATEEELNSEVELSRAVTCSRKSLSPAASNVPRQFAPGFYFGGRKSLRYKPIGG